MKRYARPLVGSATLLATAACALWITNLEIRPPCAPGYVRLLDLPAVLPEVAGVIAVTSGVTYVIARKARPTTSRGILRTIAAAVLFLLALLLAVGGLGAVASDHGPFDNSCWTF